MKEMRRSIRDPLFENKLAALVLVAALVVFLPPIFYVKAARLTDVPIVKQAAPPEPRRPDIAAMLAKSDPAAGERAAGLCKGCHRVEKDGGNSIGPTLWGVYGRAIASVSDFNYSAALATHKDKQWTAEELDAFLENPMSYASGTAMAISVPQAQARADIIAYLKTLTDKSEN